MSQALASGTITATGGANAITAAWQGDPYALITINGYFSASELNIEISDDGVNWYSPSVFDIVNNVAVNQTIQNPAQIPAGSHGGGANSMFVIWPCTTIKSLRVWSPLIGAPASGNPAGINVRISSFNNPPPQQSSGGVGGVSNLFQQLLIEAARIRIGLGLLADVDLAALIPAGGNPLNPVGYPQ